MVSSERLICPFDMPSTSISNYKDETYKEALFVLAASITLHSAWRDGSQRSTHRCSSVPWVGVQAFYSTYCSSLRFLCTISSEIVGNVFLRLRYTHHTYYGITYYIYIYTWYWKLNEPIGSGQRQISQTVGSQHKVILPSFVKLWKLDFSPKVRNRGFQNRAPRRIFVYTRQEASRRRICMTRSFVICTLWLNTVSLARDNQESEGRSMQHAQNKSN